MLPRGTDQADWIGVQATPHASLFIQSLIEQSGADFTHILVDHEVPLKNGSRLNAKVVNWPKGFYVKGLRPPGNIGARAILFSLLAQHPVPKGAESKYENAIQFFDHIKKTQKLGSSKAE